MPATFLVILTREPEDNARMKEKLIQHGIATLEYPCIATRLKPYQGGEICPNKTLKDFQIIAFLSKRGVAGMEPVFEELRKSKQLLAAVGPATALVIEKQIRRKAEIIAEPKTAKGLAQTITARFKNPVPVLLVRGNKTTRDFRRILEQKNFPVCDLVVYENYEPRLKPLSLRKKAIVVFASPSAARNFYRVNSHLKNKLRAVAIGPTTKKELQRIQVPRITVASQPDPDYLLECVIKLIKEEKK